MTYATYGELMQRFFQYFQEKQYAEALELMTNERHHFPDERVLVDYFTMCAAARIENRVLVYSIAEQLLAEGIWLGEVLWRQSPSFIPLQGDPGFERLVSLSKTAQDKDLPEVKPVLVTHWPEGYTPASPLLVALHGNQSNAEKTLPFWQSANSQGWGLAVAQSSQVMFKDAYVWDDLEISFAEVAAHIESLKPDPQRTVVAGHSMGGLVAIQLALTNPLNVRGFIANGPAVPFLDTPEALEPLLEPARLRGLRGYFIVGENDDAINAQEVQSLVQKLKAAEIACEIETVPLATHDYTPAYDAALIRALEFVGSN